MVDYHVALEANSIKADIGKYDGTVTGNQIPNSIVLTLPLVELLINTV